METSNLDIGQVAKFSYLKKLLVQRVTAVTVGLPFNKNILTTKIIWKAKESN